MRMLEKICALIAEKGYGQLAFERLAALPKNRISKWKDGKGEPSARQIYRIARLLNTTVDYLVDDSLNSPPVAEFTADERTLIRLVRGMSLDLDTAIHRLTIAPSVTSPGTPYRDTEESHRRRRGGSSA